MLGAVRLQASYPKFNPPTPFSPKHYVLRPFHLRFPIPRLSSLAAPSANNSSAASPPSQPSETFLSSHFTSSIGSSSLHLSPTWRLTQRHIFFFNVIACAAAVSATWLFCSAIPTLLAFKRAAESLEKLMDATREELPDTMAAIRLSGMEISDLTMELSDIGQEITQGVRSSTRAVRLAEERLRRLTNVAPSASVQGLVTLNQTRIDKTEPVLAKTARSMREGIVKGRAILQIFFTLTQFSRIALRYLTGGKKR